jgi:hypothetical protein
MTARLSTRDIDGDAIFSAQVKFLLVRLLGLGLFFPEKYNRLEARSYSNIVSAGAGKMADFRSHIKSLIFSLDSSLAK